MHIQSLYVYPLKSLRAIALDSTRIHALGPLHDRVFLLQRELPPVKPEDGPPYKNMHISDHPQLCLFAPEFLPSGTELLVRYSPPLPNESREVVIPLTPETVGLVQREVVMHNSACLGYDMGDSYAEFFAACLGFPVRLVYLGSSRRPVLGSVVPSVTSVSPSDHPPKAEISFADCAPLLITTQKSVEAVSERLAGDEAMDITKFRPNIVLAADTDGELEPWEEDFWGELEIAGHPIVLTANCVRCKSINVDYATGATMEPDRQPLKLLMKDRRIDPGMKYNPVFGRYGFITDASGAGVVVSVGDKVVVSKRNQERTVFYWPGLSAGTTSA